MARGWESKSVEEQVEQSQTKKDKKKGYLSPLQLENRRRREVLKLSRARVERELQSSQNPRYREQLSRALADLDAQIAELSESS